MTQQYKAVRCAVTLLSPARAGMQLFSVNKGKMKEIVFEEPVDTVVRNDRVDLIAFRPCLF